MLLLPTWTIIHARFWKLQVPYLARHFPVVVYDGPGNGLSERTTDPARYTFDAYAADAAAVLDACGVERAVVVGRLARGSVRGCDSPAIRPDLVAGLVLVGGALVAHRAPRARPERRAIPRPGTGVAHRVGALQPRLLARPLRRVRAVVLRAGVLRAALDQGDRGRRRLGAETGHHPRGRGERKPRSAVEGPSLLDGVTCPTLVVHGDEDRVLPHERPCGRPGSPAAPLVSFEGSGHMPNLRDPVRFNLLLREFAERVA